MRVFFPTSRRDERDLRQMRVSLCNPCPVRLECQEYGRSTNSRGWWGNWAEERYMDDESY